MAISARAVGLIHSWIALLSRRHVEKLRPVFHHFGLRILELHISRTRLISQIKSPCGKWRPERVTPFGPHRGQMLSRLFSAPTTKDQSQVIVMPEL